MTMLTTRRALLSAAPAMLASTFVAQSVAASAVATGEPDLSTIEGRIAACCDWFGLTPPTLTYDEEDPAGGPLMTDALLDWMLDSGVSLDWLISGEVKGMAAVFRRATLKEKEFTNALKQFDDVEVRLLHDAVKARLEQGIPLEQALEGWKAGVQAHRMAG
ncbi:hypothetical protein [Rubellimicrobium roseum]|uniref:Uncharacterized protein n=1 Tax=Rubellimicrobium roseum TaxID=687525 RepID=A0A5C4NP28_9RHOB|nr:hypothetical protein [Rubellimicrobium roseum]TNC74149.1 hypothetical protein FHG71_02855 [Rubellimicrobium roseum]